MTKGLNEALLRHLPATLELNSYAKGYSDTGTSGSGTGTTTAFFLETRSFFGFSFGCFSSSTCCERT